MSTTFCTTWPSPLGAMLLAADDDGLAGAWFDGQRHFSGRDAGWIVAGAHPVLREAIAQLEAYFAGTRRSFDLPLAPRGTAFQRDVWRAIGNVPYGATITYAALAAHAGAGNAARAAGAATGRNPLSILVPCHRIVGTTGALTGYAGGLDRKRFLLALETSVAAGQRRAA